MTTSPAINRGPKSGRVVNDPAATPRPCCAGRPANVMIRRMVLAPAIKLGPAPFTGLCLLGPPFMAGLRGENASLFLFFLDHSPRSRGFLGRVFSPRRTLAE